MWSQIGDQCSKLSSYNVLLGSIYFLERKVEVWRCNDVLAGK